MTLEDFAESCRKLTQAGFDVRHAEYHGQVFGNWLIEFTRKGIPLHCLVWDGKERWLLLQSQGSGGTWQDKWLARDLQE